MATNLASRETLAMLDDCQKSGLIVLILIFFALATIGERRRRSGSHRLALASILREASSRRLLHGTQEASRFFRNRFQGGEAHAPCPQDERELNGSACPSLVRPLLALHLLAQCLKGEGVDGSAVEKGGKPLGLGHFQADANLFSLHDDKSNDCYQ